MSTPNMDRARSAWGVEMPDWIEALALACDEAASQGKVAKRLGKSPTTINQVLGKKYPARLGEFEARVRGEFMRATVVCPVLLEISTRRCQDEQTRPFSTSSRIAAELSRECAKCPNRRKP